MSANGQRSFFSILKDWLRRYQITIINASVTVVLIGTVIFVLLNRASTLHRKTAEESVVNLAGMAANEVRASYISNFDTVRTLSRIMQNYQTIEVRERRAFFNGVMQGILNSNSSLVSVYTLWKANELDGMDREFVNTPNSDDTGQYITGYTRERGWIESKAFPEYKYLLNVYDDDLSDYINATISEPSPKIVDRKTTWVIDVQVSITRDSAIVGIVGVTINLEPLQNLVESIQPFETGRTMVCSGNGTIIAHYNSQLRGINLAEAQVSDSVLSAAIHKQVYRTTAAALEKMGPSVHTAGNMLLVGYPLRTTNAGAARAINETYNPPWTVVTVVPLRTMLSPIHTLLRFSVIFIFGAGITAAVVVFFTSNSLTQRARYLQHDLERATTMRDNLKYGLFFMDQKFIIQGAYSKALEKILSVSGLQGKSFMELLAASIKEREQDGLADYFEMIFKRSFDDEMLESINPIDNFTYISVTGGEIKNLRASFILAEWGRGTPYILATLEDTTAEKELQKQLHEVESQREKEMQSLFQVIQLNPRVLGDFIEDAEYEFNQVNELFKSQQNYNLGVLVEMYQSIHAVKSNALILNLEDFALKLHGLETSIKNLRERPESDVTFDDFLGLILEFNEVMREKDQLKTAIRKIENFKNQPGMEISQERYVLMETINQACKKAQAGTDKQAALAVEAIDETILTSGPRRVIKEVLTQLIRNAVYHGIEPAAEREAAGKAAEGEIRLSVRHIGGEIIIKISDDGRGIDLDRIRQKALVGGLFADPREADEKNNLLRVMFMPGFSTAGEEDMQAGRGIGLSLVWDRINALHGNIMVSTAAGRGTTFTVNIPLESPAAEGVTTISVN